MKGNNFKVYKHTFPNGKVYIGCTGRKTCERWSGGHGYRTQPEVFNAIMEYGWKNIKHEILHDGLSEKEAKSLEIAEIKLHESWKPEYGYNKIIGSGSGSRPEYIRKRISESMTGDKNHMYGKHLTEEHKQKIRETRKELGYEPVNKQKVICEETGIIYESTAEATRETGVHNSSIRRVCYGKRLTAGGYHWRYVD